LTQGYLTEILQVRESSLRHPLRLVHPQLAPFAGSHGTANQSHPPRGCRGVDGSLQRPAPSRMHTVMCEAEKNESQTYAPRLSSQGLQPRRRSADVFQSEPSYCICSTASTDLARLFFTCFQPSKPSRAEQSAFGTPCWAECERHSQLTITEKSPWCSATPLS